MLDLETVTEGLLDKYHAAGVRSVRLDFFRFKGMDNVEIQAELIKRTAERLAQWGKPNWSIQIQQPHLHFCTRLRRAINDSPIPVAIPVVVDHFALIARSSFLVMTTFWLFKTTPTCPFRTTRDYGVFVTHCVKESYGLSSLLNTDDLILNGASST